jgi:ribulose-phosphate 3-epimerase
MVDMILVMSVNPGFGGQSFIERSVEKVAEIAWMCEQLGASPVIQVDGGINAETAALVAAAGARSLVAGNAVYGSDDPAAAIAQIRAAALAAIA